VESSAFVEEAEKFVASGNWQAASIAYARLALSYPDEPDVFYLHGRVLMELGDWDAALSQFNKALSINPKDSRFHRCRGDVLQAMDMLLEAENAYRCAIDLNPRDTDALINLGNTIYKEGRSNGALAPYGRALAFDPENLKALNNIGKTWHDQGDLKKAKIWYETALKLNPNYPEAHFNHAIALLAEGDFRNGWQEYEWRFHRQSARQVYPHQLNILRWNGAPFQDKRLLVHCEQGLGDVIQFCRYMPMVKALGGTVTLEVHASLVSLLEHITSVDRIIPFGRLKPREIDYDLYVPLMSLPLLFGTTIESIPAQIPYLHPSPVEVSRWQSRLSSRCGARIGLVWSGSATDPRRSCPWEIISRLTKVMTNLQFFSLQKQLPPGITADLLEHANMIHWGNSLVDFHATAAAISHLDLVISIDTATAHLAGAMGKPVWILLPHAADWRWLQIRSDTPWYPTARLFRQPEKDDWRALVSTLVEELKQWSPASHH